jgi:RNA polymerase-binding transcription factor DksA
VTFAISTPPGDPQDTADRAAMLEEMDRTIALRQHLAEVRVLDDQRIDADGVVHCGECDLPIEPARLAALAPKDAEGRPILELSAATLCIECQRAEEHRQWREARG